MKPPTDPLQFDLSRVRRHLVRALLLRCPHCGARGIFHRWVRMVESCPECHLRMDRGETDYFIGGYTVNFVTAELVIVGAGLLAIVLSWPEVPWKTIQWGLIGLMIPFPIFTYPWSKCLWLSLDLVFRPPTLLDFEAHGENRPRLPGEAPERSDREPPSP